MRSSVLILFYKNLRQRIRYSKMIWLFFIATAFLDVDAFSQSIHTETLDRYFQAMESNDKFMGCVLITRGNQKLYSRDLGYANIHGAIKSDDKTMYRIGSISKTITAALVMKAIEEGKIDFESNIKNFFPSVKHAEQITVRQLLNHHSGVPNFTQGDYNNWRTQTKKRVELIQAIAKGGSDFAPGTKAAYSNSNYVLLSFILEDLYGKSYGEVLSSKIIRPLQLKHFQFGDKMTDAKKKANSYHFEAGWNSATETDLSIPMGAGAILSSAEDLAKVLNALLTGKLVSKRMLNKMTEQADGFGLGLFQEQVIGNAAYTHNGSIDGFLSYFYYFPADGTLYVLLSNANNYNLETVNKSVLSIAYNKPVDLPVFKTYKTTTNDLNQYSGTYTSASNPLVIQIWNKNNFLLAQPQGEGVYTLDAIEEHKFYHEKTAASLEFDPAKQEMILKQGGQSLIFNKQSSQPATQATTPVTQSPLYKQLVELDQNLFNAFNKGELESFMAFFSKDLEFYHDRSGLTDYAHNEAVFKRNFSNKEQKIRRELVAGSMEVHAMGEYGALQSGVHHFYLTANGKEQRVATAKFIRVWKNENGNWLITREMSYDHH
jgi:D-alanyl-D-alanine carboxypeptidase